MTDKQMIIKRIRDCDNCKFRPETSKVCSDYENCYMVSEYIVNLREQLKSKEQENKDLREDIKNIAELLDLDTGEEYSFGNIELEMKQLKRKEQECEELRGVIRKDICSHYVLGECSQKHHNNCVGRNQCIKDLEQQLDQLKAENETYKKMLENEEIQLALNEVRTGERHLWFNKAEKFKNCLTEIKEIIHFNKTNRLSGGADISIEQILQKITECEVENGHTTN